MATRNTRRQGMRPAARQLSLNQSARARRNHPSAPDRKPDLFYTLAIVAFLIFATLAVNLVARGYLVSGDVAISQRLHAIARANPPLVPVMRFGSILGQEVIMVIAAALAAYWFTTRNWTRLALLGLGVGGGSLWFLLLSNAFHRQRPSFPDPLFPPLTVPGFPSGHTISSVLTYGLLAYLILPKIKKPAVRLLVLALTALIVVYIGFSRVFLGDHYLTDVVAGACVGIAWGALVLSLVERYRARHATATGKA